VLAGEGKCRAVPPLLRTSAPNALEVIGL
jgi:hypothetical protein